MKKFKLTSILRPIFLSNLLKNRISWTMEPPNINDNNENDIDMGEENGQETHMRAKNNLDPKIVKNLENEILRTMQSGSTVVDPLFNSGLPDSTLTSSASTTLTSSLYTSNSVSMESFTLETFVAAASISTESEKKYTTQKKCCSSSDNSDPTGPQSKQATKTANSNPKTHNLNSNLYKNAISHVGDQSRPLLPPPAPEDHNKICLVLDLDETLVHSSFLSIPHADFRFVLGTEDNQIGVFVCIRPGAEKFLKELGNLYEIVVFTASCQPYADTVIDYIDPGRVVKYRLYRESCTDFGGNFVKDLSRLNRSLERIIIIDNSPSAYLLQPYNAIAIASWFDEPMDNELLLILDFLKQSYRVKNVYDLFSPE